MSKFESPWMRTQVVKPKACHYGCGMPATLIEPGRSWTAHKVCAEAAERGERVPPSSKPLGQWDGEEHKLVPDRPIGCGTSPPRAVSGRFCAGTGAQNACQLCPRSPNYWKRDRPESEWVEFFGTVT